MVNSKTELLNFLKNPLNPLHVVVMPDFFLDRIITLDYTFQDFTKLLSKIVKQKGGSIDGIKQIQLRGGNAINVASALTALGIKVTPIITTSKNGLKQLKYVLGKQIETSHIKITSDPSITTALEFKTKNEKTNVMLRDLGSLADFGLHSLNEDDFKLIENADYICLFNWAGTKNHGTELAKTIFKKTKTLFKGKTYYDPADPNPNINAINELIKLLKSPYVDTLSLNENEAITYANILEPKKMQENKTNLKNQLALHAAKILTQHFPSRIDLHTTTFSASLTKNNLTTAPAFKIHPKRATGAGDSWDAANIIAQANHLTDKSRLILSNALAAFYLINPEGLHPTRKQLYNFIEKTSKINLKI